MDTNAERRHSTRRIPSPVGTVISALRLAAGGNGYSSHGGNDRGWCSTRSRRRAAFRRIRESEDQGICHTRSDEALVRTPMSLAWPALTYVSDAYTREHHGYSIGEPACPIRASATRRAWILWARVTLPWPEHSNRRRIASISAEPTNYGSRGHLDPYPPTRGGED